MYCYYFISDWVQIRLDKSLLEISKESYLDCTRIYFIWSKFFCSRVFIVLKYWEHMHVCNKWINKNKEKVKSNQCLLVAVLNQWEQWWYNCKQFMIEIHSMVFCTVQNNPLYGNGTKSNSRILITTLVSSNSPSNQMLG